MLFKQFIPIYHPSKYMRVSDTITVPIWRWKYLFLWSLNLHLFVMNEAEYTFTCFKEIPLWNKNKQFLFLFCEVCLYDLCLVSIGLLFFLLIFSLYITKTSFFHMPQIFFISCILLLYILFLMLYSVEEFYCIHSNLYVSFPILLYSVMFL